MKKPSMKREIAVDYWLPEARVIYFYATNGAAASFHEFGRVRAEDGPSQWALTVDPRFDFHEILQYMEQHP